MTKYTAEQRSVAFWSKVDQSAGPLECWNWIGALRDVRRGYGLIVIRGKKFGAHRIAWTLVNGSIPDGLFVCHKCDNPSCCNPAHLFLGTPKDNSQDRERKNRSNHPKGEQHANAKLTWDDIIRIRQRYSDGETQTAIAKDYGVWQSAIGAIVRGEKRKDH